jgi:hypothetical protein
MSSLPQSSLLSFANLLEVADLCASPGSDYEVQRELVVECRRSLRPFLASMPVRHLFKCPICGVQRGEVEFHFEDPSRPLTMIPNQGLWGVPVGQHVDIELSVLHEVLVHGRNAPPALQELLAGRDG